MEQECLEEEQGEILVNKEELKHKVRSIVSSTLKEEIYISPVELLMKIGVLSAKDYEDWRFGRVPYLEKVCKTNLSKLSFIMKELRAYALENHLKSSWTEYNQWGVKGKKIPLRFSKSGDTVIEEAYATHYVVNTKKEERGSELSTTPKERNHVCIHKDAVFLLDDVGGLSGFADFLGTVYESEDKKERDELRAWAKSLGWSEKKIANKRIL